jgi:hypothetical protein
VRAVNHQRRRSRVLPGDRTRIRDGLVCENYIFFDPIQFQTFVNGEVPSI